MNRVLDEFIYPVRPPHSKPKRLHTNPLDELDTLNHFCFSGGRNLIRDFFVLTVNDHSPGDETIFLAVQLYGTESSILHYDSCPAALDFVRRRAESLGVAESIRFVSGPLASLVDAVLGNSTFPSVPGFGPFDYIRCTNGLGDQEDFDRSFDFLLHLMKRDGVLGFSCFGVYGREPYRQFQQIAESLNGDHPGLAEEIDRLKELFPFLPESNWTRLSFDLLDPAVRSGKDEAFIGEFLRKDRHAWSVPRIYDLLDDKGLRLAQYSRLTRMFYEPWFAGKDRELSELLGRLSARERESVSEIAWSSLERHHFWAVRDTAFHADPGNTDNIPFFNPFSSVSKNWKQAFLDAGPNVSPELLIEPTPMERYSVVIPWGPIPYRFVRLVDGFKTLGEIFMMIRDEWNGDVGLDEIAAKCIRFMLAVEREDMILLRHKTLPLLPFTARRLAG